MTADEHNERLTEAKRLVQFVAHMCWNLCTDEGYGAQVEGHEHEILEAFRKAAELDRSAFIMAAYDAAGDLP